MVGSCVADPSSSTALIELIDGVQVTSLTQDADQVQIEAMRNGEYIHSLKSKLVIAADGRDSFVVKQLV
jgi:2-octaprenyl-6-methoxyphenol hydroxylase